MPARSLDLPADAWTRLDNLARRLALPLDQVIAQFAGRIELLDHVAGTLAIPITPAALPLRCAPAAPVSEQIAVIHPAGARSIATRLPRADERFIEVVKRLRYRWDGVHWWTHQVSKFEEPRADRLVELGVHLLAAGFIIEVPNEELQRRVIASDYAPAERNWVTARTSGKFAGWFCVQWDRAAHGADDYYRRLALIRGARCYPGSALIRRDRYEEVLDFAEMHRFAVSDGALDLVAQARRERDAMLLVTPRVQTRSEPEPEPEPEIPEGILDELADEPV